MTMPMPNAEVTKLVTNGYYRRIWIYRFQDRINLSVSSSR